MREPLIRLGLSCCALLAAACAEPPPPPGALHVALEARTASAEPVPGMRVWANARDLGETNAEGKLAASLTGFAGERVSLTWACPAAYRAHTEQRSVALEAAAGAKAALRAQCEPLERSAALVVRVSGAPSSGVAVRVRNELVARTDADGVAHTILRVRPNTPLSVALDTREYPDLLPRDPVETFQLGEDDSILLFERTLTAAPKPPVNVKRRIRREPERRLPYRIH